MAQRSRRQRNFLPPLPARFGPARIAGNLPPPDDGRHGRRSFGYRDSRARQSPRIESHSAKKPFAASAVATGGGERVRSRGHSTGEKRGRGSLTERGGIHRDVFLSEDGGLWLGVRCCWTWRPIDHRDCPMWRITRRCSRPTTSMSVRRQPIRRVDDRRFEAWPILHHAAQRHPDFGSGGSPSRTEA